MGAAALDKVMAKGREWGEGEGSMNNPRIKPLKLRHLAEVVARDETSLPVGCRPTKVVGRPVDDEGG